MRRTLFGGVLLLGAMTFSLLTQAQQPGRRFRLPSADVAVTYNAESGKTVGSDDRFWMQGGSLDAAFPVFHGLGVAVNLSGQHASEISSSVDLSKITFVAGPRYTFNTTRFTERMLKSKRATSIFGESLFGTVHGFNGLFPSATGGTRSSANALAMQIGGGVGVSLGRGFGLRPVQVHYIYTALPNGSTDTQHDVRLGAGITYHIGR